MREICKGKARCWCREGYRVWGCSVVMGNQRCGRGDQKSRTIMRRVLFDEGSGPRVEWGLVGLTEMGLKQKGIWLEVKVWASGLMDLVDGFVIGLQDFRLS